MDPAPLPPIPFAAAARFWLRIGCLSFGGPAGQIALLHRELVDRRRWLADAEFARALNFCMLLPGPEALQLAIWLGWRLHGVAGGVVAGLCFVLPAAVLLLGLSWVYVAHGELPAVAGVLAGLEAVVVALVAQALLRLAPRALQGPAAIGLAVAAFAALQFADAPFPLVLAVAAAVGALALRAPTAPGADRGGAVTAGATVARLGRWFALGLAAWTLPWLAIPRVEGDFAAPLYLFLTQAALVTFGGAYAVLAYVHEHLVETLGWLTPQQVVAGLALAETTPGPLVLVLQFHGFLVGWTQSASAPLAGALAGAALASWATFLPSFVLILAFAPYVERLARRPRLAGALAGVTAAVVGVIASLAVAIAMAVLWSTAGAFDWARAAIAAVAFALLAGTRIDLGWVLAAGALAGWASAVAGPGPA